MNKSLFGTGRFFALITIMFLYSAPSDAYEQFGLLGTAPSATDYYQVNCVYDGVSPTVKLNVSVASGLGPRVAVVVSKGNGATSTFDSTEGGLPSPTVSLNGASGIYNVFVQKHRDPSPGGRSVTYQLSLFCITRDNYETALSPQLKQNQ